jgi:hypothetical protein
MTKDLLEMTEMRMLSSETGVGGVVELDQQTEAAGMTKKNDYEEMEM